jgi:hypothetical protein
MRAAAVCMVLSACFFDDGGGSSPPRPPPPPLPAECGCIGDLSDPASDECCASIVCYLDESTNEWLIEICDFPPPPPLQCEQCNVLEICVQRYDGNCQVQTSCELQTVECPDNVCSPDCEQAYCSAPLQCQNRPPCGDESPLAFTCYGP